MSEAFIELPCRMSDQFAVQVTSIRFKAQDKGFVCLTAVAQLTLGDGTKTYIPALSAIDQQQLGELIAFLERQRVPN